jgi:PQQ-like domain
VVPVSPFPSQARWTLAFDQPLAAPPAYDGESGFFPLEDGRILVYELNRGTLKWQAPVRTQKPPVVGDGLLFVELAETLEARQASDGAVAWTAPLASKLTAPLAWHDGRLVAASGTSVVLFQATDGTMLWRRDVRASVEAAPTLAGDRVVVPTADGHVVALRVTDGETLWDRRLGGPGHAILVVGERLFVGSSDNFLYCLSALDGQVEWRWQTGADVVSLPVADRDHVYFVSLDNVLRALNQRNGVQQWKRPLQFRPAWGPVRAADALVLTSVDGPPHAFMLKDGAPGGDMITEAGAELAAPLHVFQGSGTIGPVVVAVTRRLVSGATVMAASRSVDPVAVPLLPLPGLIPMGPTPAGPAGPR